jgi:hypothetical protein
VICGTRGVPGTVAPFRAWRGSRDLVAQSPKFHAPAVAPQFMEPFAQLQTKILAQRYEHEQSRGVAGIHRSNSLKIFWTRRQNRVL